MATAAEKSSGEQCTHPSGNEGQSPGDIPVDEQGVRGKKRHHAYGHPQANGYFDEDSQRQDIFDDSGRDIEFYWTRTTTCKFILDMSNS